jgi:hypothetical protein
VVSGGRLWVPAAPASLLAALARAATGGRVTGGGAWKVGAGRGGYAAAALARECDRVAATTTPGSRNTTLNAAAFNLGQLVGAALLDEDQAVTELSAAAASCGLGPVETARTIASGLAAGTRRPRTGRGAR